MDIQIHDQLARELAESGPPPIDPVVQGALVAGARLRRRRRLTLAGGGAVGFVALAAVIVAAASSLGTAPAVSPTHESGLERPSTTPSSTPTGKQATTPEAVIALLISRLPTGGRITEEEGDTTGPGIQGSLLYDDGHGAATVLAVVANEYPMICLPPGDAYQCERSTTSDGAEILVETAGPFVHDCPAVDCSIKVLRVSMKRTDGVYVVVNAFNGPRGHNRAATRANTLLDKAQIIALVSDPRWGLTMDASFVEAANQTVHLSPGTLVASAQVIR
jgi:hypothetical protein